MLAIQRFFSMIFCIGLVMILYPDFGAAGWTFAGTMIVVGVGVLLIMSIINNLFSLYRFEGINRFLTWIFLAATLFAMLWLFPQDDNVTPVNKLKYGELPTAADIKRGIDKFSFNFAFDKRNARSDENFVNQRDKKAEAEEAAKIEAAKKEAAEKARRAAAKAKQAIEIIVED